MREIGQFSQGTAALRGTCEKEVTNAFEMYPSDTIRGLLHIIKVILVHHGSEKARYPKVQRSGLPLLYDNNNKQQPTPQYKTVRKV